MKQEIAQNKIGFRLSRALQVADVSLWLPHSALLFDLILLCSAFLLINNVFQT